MSPGETRGRRPILWNHDEIVQAAVWALCQGQEFRFGSSTRCPTPTASLTAPFKLHQLRKVHEAVIGEELHRDPFPRRMMPNLSPVARGGEW